MIFLSTCHTKGQHLGQTATAVPRRLVFGPKFLSYEKNWPYWQF